MARYWRCRGLKLAIASSVLVGGASAIFGDCALAQITPDGTLPNNSIVTSQSNTSVISGGTQAGSNLFHSFEQFSVPTGSAAYFNNALDIQNIFSRVTGGSISNIDGLIQANGTANVFLLNPNGIIFGPNATLAIGGSILASTASSLNFADGNQFSATAHPTTPLLTVSVPIGLQFGGTAGSIVNQSQATNSSAYPGGLQVQPGKTLALVGGDVWLDGGNLQASGGIVELGGVAALGTVGLAVDGNNLSLSFPDQVERADVSFTNATKVNVSASNGGSIAINAQNLNIAGKSILQAGIASGLGSIGSVAGDIEINAQEAINLTDDSSISNQVQPGAVGNSGDINIQSGSLAVRNGAQIKASTLGQGNAGDVNIHAARTVSFDGMGSNKDSSAAYSSVVTKTAVGNGGNINITTGSLFVTNGAQLAATTKGQGDAGSVTIVARDTVLFDGVGGGAASGAFTQAKPEPKGNGGNIDITASSLAVRNGAQLSATTFSQGDAGSVNINAREWVSFDGVSSDGQSSAAYSSVAKEAVGNSGGINITTGTLSVTNGAHLDANTWGRGNAGSVIIKARDTVSFNGVNSNNKNQSGAYSTVTKNGYGNSGDINIRAGSVSVTNGSQLNASTRGQGNAGSVTITADTVSFDGVGSNGSDSGAFSIVEENKEAMGNSGGIVITTGSLAVTNGSQLNASTRGKGNAGSVTITADTVSFDGEYSNGLSSAAYSNVADEAVGEGGNIDITTGSLTVTNGARLAASTRGQGNAGSVIINARDSVLFDGVGSYNSSTAFSEVTEDGIGNGGSIDITTGSLAIRNGALLSASARGQGNGGDITLNANTLEAVNGGQVLTTSRSSGKAGNITLNVTKSVTLSGRDPTYNDRLAHFGEEKFVAADPASGLFASTSKNSTGQGGSLKITTGQLIVRDGAEITVSSEGSGNAGNLKIASRNLLLDNQAALRATTESGEGGNIELLKQDLILMRHNSEISTLARGTGNGGNIDIIDADLIVAVPSEDSNILTNAFEGNGGNINITTQGIFGLEFREQPMSLSDISASSKFGVDGVVEINTPDIDPSQELAALAAELVDASGLIASGCAASGENEFIITGRGGLPPDPTKPLDSDAIWIDWVTLNPRVENRSSPNVSIKTIREIAPTQIVEAQGWVINALGEVVLTANAPTTTPHSPWLTQASCRHAPETSS